MSLRHPGEYWDPSKKMLNIRRQRHIKFATIEKPMAWIVVAIAVEREGNEIVYVSEPKVVRVIPKKPVSALPGTVAPAQKTLLLATPKIHTVHKISRTQIPVVSTYFSGVDVLTWFAARPPTKK